MTEIVGLSELMKPGNTAVVTGGEKFDNFEHVVQPALCNRQPRGLVLIFLPHAAQLTGIFTLLSLV